MEKLIKAGNYLIDRLKEPSSHNAIGVLCIALGTQANYGVLDAVMLLAGTVFTTLGFFVAEKK